MMSSTNSATNNRFQVFDHDHLYWLESTACIVVVSRDSTGWYIRRAIDDTGMKPEKQDAIRVFIDLLPVRRDSWYVKCQAVNWSKTVKHAALFAWIDGDHSQFWVFQQILLSSLKTHQRLLIERSLNREVFRQPRRDQASSRRKHVSSSYSCRLPTIMTTSPSSRTSRNHSKLK